MLVKKNGSTLHIFFINFRDGAEAVGVFCVLHNVLQQLHMDNEIDIFTAVRQIQIRRPEIVTKLVKLL